MNEPKPEPPENENESVNEEILEDAKERMKRAVDGDRENRIDALDDLRILSGVGQWPEEIRRFREADGRPCLVVNQLPQFLRQVTGDIRGMNPGITVTPADSAADKLTAEAMEGIIRHIQYRSDASSVFERAAESAASCGMGFFRILAEYEREDSFNQDIRVETIHNPFSVYFDPDAMMPTREDAEWVLITEIMDVDEFNEEYPDKASVPVANDGVTDHLQYWRTGNKVTIAEYYWKEYKPSTIYLMDDGTVLQDPEKSPPKRRIVQQRKTTKTVVNWAKVSGGDVLEGPQVIPGKYIPVVAVMGEELYTGERIYRSSVIRHAKDQQRIYNYTWSAMVEGMALQTKAPWLATPTQVAGYESMWATPDENRTALLYNPDPQAGGPPQRIAPAMASSGLTNVLAISAQDLRSTTGIQDAALGKRSNEQSGVAIRQRQAESDNATSIYADNMGKAIEQSGRILVNWIPQIYDTARQVRIIGSDESQQMIPVNQSVMTHQGPVTLDLSKGQYDVQVNVGPNYATKKQAAMDGMMQFVQAVPNAGAVIGDLIAKNADWPGADEIADRLKKALPPGMAGDQQQQPDPAQQQQMQQQMAMQQRQMEAANIAQELEIRTATAKALQAEAQAAKAQAEASAAQAAVGYQVHPQQMLPMQQMPQPGMMATPQGEPQPMPPMQPPMGPNGF